MFWLRNNKCIFLLRTLNKVLVLVIGSITSASQRASVWHNFDVTKAILSAGYVNNDTIIENDWKSKIAETAMPLRTNHQMGKWQPWPGSTIVP